MYDRSSAATDVDEARLHMFARKQRPYDSIPPTQAALREHAKRAAYQAGVIWGQLPGTDQMFVQERLHQKVQMPSFWTCLYSILQLRVSTLEL